MSKFFESFASPVYRNGFVYDERGFLANPNAKGTWRTEYPREEPKDLYQLLVSTSESKHGKANKKSKGLEKDEHPISYYRAQLKHYGLEDRTTKQAARNALLDAFKPDRDGIMMLCVPENIKLLEEEMRIEWENKDENCAKDILDEAEKGYVQNSFADGEYFLEQAERRQTRWDALSNKPQLLESFMMLEKLDIQAVVQSLLNDFSLEVTSATMAAIKYRIMLSEEHEHSDNPGPGYEEKPRLGKRSRSYRNTKCEQASKKRKLNTPPIVYGTYHIHAPFLADQWPAFVKESSPLTLEIYPSSTDSRIWGQFKFGVFEGIIRTSPFASSPASSTGCTKLNFSWRGYENGEYEMLCDDEYNLGTLVFSPEGKVMGLMDAQSIGDKIRFSGYCTSGVKPKGQWPGIVKEWKIEYRDINWDGYDAGKEVWFGGNGLYSASEPELSDTSAEWEY